MVSLFSVPADFAAAMAGIHTPQTQPERLLGEGDAGPTKWHPTSLHLSCSVARDKLPVAALSRPRQDGTAVDASGIP